MSYRAWIIVCLLPATAALAGCSGSTRTVPGPTVTATMTETATATVTATPIVRKVIATHTRTATVTYHPTYSRYGEGTYVVGTDIQPGTYHTAGGGDCYWARLSSLDTGDIIDNGNTTGPTTIQVESSDRALQIQGSCTFGRA